jgi:site-specific DNA recombinase
MTTTSKATGRCALYSRLSNRPGESKVMTVAEQERILRAEAERLELDVAGAFADNGISAFKRVHRPGFGDLLASIERREVSHVLVVALDRASRRVADIAALRDACEDHGVMIVADGKVYDPADDALSLYLSAIVGENESREKSKRVLRAKETALARGLYAGGRRPFGFIKRPDAAPGFWDQEPKEAKAIRDGYDLILGGAPLIEVAQLWNRRGLRTTTAGNAWSFAHVRRALLSPIVAGQRTSGGEVTGALMLPDGSAWPAIVTEREHDRLARALASRYPAKDRWHTPAPALLSGLLTCGLCKNKLTVRRYSSSNRQLSYACASDGGDRCGGVSIAGHRIEADITNAVLRRLAATSKVKAGLSKRTKAKRQGPDPADLQNDLDLLADAAGRGELPMRDYLRARKPLEARLQAARAVDHDDDRGRVLGPFTRDPLAAWDNADLERRRLVLTAVIDRIEVAPATSNVYTADRFKVFWKA